MACTTFSEGHCQQGNLEEDKTIILHVVQGARRVCAGKTQNSQDTFFFLICEVHM